MVLKYDLVGERHSHRVFTDVVGIITRYVERPESPSDPLVCFTRYNSTKRTATPCMWSLSRFSGWF